MQREKVPRVRLYVGPETECFSELMVSLECQTLKPLDLELEVGGGARRDVLVEKCGRAERQHSSLFWARVLAADVLSAGPIW